MNPLDSDRPIEGSENKGCTVVAQRVNREQIPTQDGRSSAEIKQLNSTRSTNRSENKRKSREIVCSTKSRCFTLSRPNKLGRLVGRVSSILLIGSVRTRPRAKGGGASFSSSGQSEPGREPRVAVLHSPYRVSPNQAASQGLEVLHSPSSGQVGGGRGGGV